MTVVLVGAPGSGKSTVGRLVAQARGEAFADVDQLIEATAGKPVAEIFADDGEPHFRALEETHTLAALKRGGVLALGGGAVTSAVVRAALTGHTVVWLQVSVGSAAQRVGLNASRPLLLGNVRGRLVQLLAERTPLYEEVATVTVATDGVDRGLVVRTITDRLDELAPRS